MATIQWTNGASGPRAVITGMITGTGDLTDLTAKQPPSGALTIDAGDIRAYTSSGIQAWLDAVRALRARGARVVFERCSPAVVRQTMSWTVGGAVIGLTLALLLTRFLASFLYGISPTDPVTFGGVTLILTLVAGVAALVPAVRASRLDPLVALRDQ